MPVTAREERREKGRALRSIRFILIRLPKRGPSLLAFGWYLTCALQLRHSTDVPTMRQIQREKSSREMHRRCRHTHTHTYTQPREIGHRSPSESEETSYRCFYEDKRERRSRRDIKAAFPLQRFAAFQVYVGNHQHRRIRCDANVST